MACGGGRRLRSREEFESLDEGAEILRDGRGFSRPLSPPASGFGDYENAGDADTGNDPELTAGCIDLGDLEKLRELQL